MPAGRREHAGASLGDCFYVAGGTQQGKLVASMDKYDARRDKWQVATPMKRARRHFAMAAMDGMLYAAGGVTASAFLASVECYDPISEQWNEVAPMTTPRAGHRLVAVDNKLFACGGLFHEGNGSISTSMERYDKTDKFVGRCCADESKPRELWTRCCRQKHLRRRRL